MSNIKKFGEYIKESNKPSSEDLSNFYKDFMKGNTKFQKEVKNYKIDTNDVRNMVENIVYTSELLNELQKRKIDKPNISKLKYKIDKEEYHRCYIYELKDSEDENFVVNIEIKVPYDEKFEDDNTLISASIFIAKKGRMKEMFGYSNKRAQKDKEFNMFSVGAVLQKTYKELKF